MAHPNADLLRRAYPGSIGDGRLETSAVLPGVPESARRARAAVTQVLGPGHPAEHAAVACVNELAANAIVPGGPAEPVTRQRAGEVSEVALCQDGAAQRRVRRSGGTAEPAAVTGDRRCRSGPGLCCRVVLAKERFDRVAHLGVLKVGQAAGGQPLQVPA